MSTREKAYRLIDMLSDEQVEGFVMMFEGFIDEIPNKETLEAIKECEDMKLHPENYKGYNDVDIMFKELLA